MPVTVVGKATNVVKTDSFAIDECVGNVATKDDRMSLARVFVSQPGEEPWLTLGYDEWIYCCSGRLVFGLPDGSTVELKAGDVIFTGTPAGVGPLDPGDAVECTAAAADGGEALPRCAFSVGNSQCLARTDFWRGLQKEHVARAALFH